MTQPGSDNSTAAIAEPDGYTLIIHIVTTAVISPLTQKDLQFNAERDFLPVAMIAKLPNVMIINRDIPAKNWREFVAWAKANPGAAAAVVKLSLGAGALLAVLGAILVPVGVLVGAGKKILRGFGGADVALAQGGGQCG